MGKAGHPAHRPLRKKNRIGFRRGNCHGKVTGYGQSKTPVWLRRHRRRAHARMTSDDVATLCGLFASIPNHFFEDGFERGLPFDGAFASTFEFDPALIEALDHLNSRHGILHALSAEDLFPSSSWNRF